MSPERQRVWSVVVADDDPLFRKILRDILTKHGHCVPGEAKTGLEAANLFVQHRPDLVLLDIDMPYGNGLTILRLLREIDPSVRVIMLTGDSSSRAVMTALKLGAKDYVAKKSGERRVMEAIGKALGE